MNIQTAVKMENEIRVPIRWDPSRSSPVKADTSTTDTTTAHQRGVIHNPETGLAQKSQREENAPVSMEALKESVEDVKKTIEGLNSRIAIKIDEDTETPVVQFIDRKSGEVIRQLPPEDMLRLRASFKDMLKGLFFNKEA